MTNATRIAARRSKDGTRGLCGRPRQDGGTCGAVVALIWPPDELRPAGLVSLPAGFVQGDDGVWTIGKRARQEWEADRRAASRGDQGAARRLGEGKSLRNRRPFGMQWLNQASHARLAEGWRPAGHRPPFGGSWDPELLIRDEPVVRCHECRLENRLTPDLLDNG
jgi:hypothetical protein